ncbi:adaptin, gamma, putative [Theileria equi strain WA]|uniref:AP-1 complex subunit gamma n=1 Tax=Theileria equi strain WA TaxID=1537102 RepID=L0B1E5_THEEQ|nr:adaptin, gamma, putative [Theileria equi strain WA]AFZ81071.1 adaptin, gamma, putative [Theileria equi strain WA]|eukprot:XP_004830737.1 adaptin, gamma, putative [Theileria equi strain WA]
MAGSVKELVRNIRSSKTAAEERAVLAKECAKIRSSLHDETSVSRRKNVSKLLFIHLLGYPTNFGQIECIKLIASSKFTDKRIGYLALNLLLTEESEVLMLATNSIKMDLNSPNPYVCELALRALANIGTIEMLRDLQYEIENLLRSNVPNIKKKTAVCATRMLRKVGQINLTPDFASLDLAKTYLQHVPTLLNDYNHGVIYAGLNLTSVLIEYFAQCCDFPALFKIMVNSLKVVNGGNSSSLGHNVEYVSSGINDPFLQVKLLSLIKLVYAKCPQTSELQNEFYDLIYGIINVTNANSNAGCSLLYECIRAVYSEFGNEKFNQLGKDVVNKFMCGNNNNIKYIALGILNNVHNVKLEYGDSNWSIIVQSFRQPDVSIRKRALNVALKLVGSDTIKPLMQHLFEFLLVADRDLKREALSKITHSLITHSQDYEYMLGTMVKIFTIAGNSVSDDILNNFIALALKAPKEAQVSTTISLFSSVKNNMAQEALVKASLWCIGEFGDYLVESQLPKSVQSTPRSSVVAAHNLLVEEKPQLNATESTDLLNLDFVPLEKTKSVEDNIEDLLDFDAPKKTPVATDDLFTIETDPLPLENVVPNGVDVDNSEKIMEIIELIAKRLMANVQGNLTSSEYLLTCVGKLTQRIPSKRERLRKLIKKFKRQANAELQQRACELDVILESEIEVLDKIMRKVPLYTVGTQPEADQNFVQRVKEPTREPSLLDIEPSAPAKPAAKKDDLLLIDFFDTPGDIPSKPEKVPTTKSINSLQYSSSIADIDLLGDMDDFDTKPASEKRMDNTDDFGQFDPF